MGAGRPKSIESPEKMWEHFTAYKKSVKDRPKLVHDFVGKEAESVYREKERPLTFEGFENYLFEQRVCSGVDQYFNNQDGLYTEFMDICRAIKRIIREDQIEGGMTGIYNPSITQRLNGLVERSETTVKQEQPLFGNDE